MYVQSRAKRRLSYASTLPPGTIHNKNLLSFWRRWWSVACQVKDSLSPLALSTYGTLSLLCFDTVAVKANEQNFTERWQPAPYDVQASGDAFGQRAACSVLELASKTCAPTKHNFNHTPILGRIPTAAIQQNIDRNTSVLLSSQCAFVS